jgi:predicted small lipoprotein YifL
MTRKNRNVLGVVACILAAALLMSGCGRRGNLEPPPSATVVETDDLGNTIEKSAPKRDNPFILDGLI